LTDAPASRRAVEARAATASAATVPAVRRLLLAPGAGRGVAAALAVLTLAVVVGLVALWPSGDVDGVGMPSSPTERATVERRSMIECDLTQRGRCQQLVVRLDSGPDRGRTSEMTLPGTELAPAFERGDALRVVRNQGGAGDAYSFSDFERRAPLYALFALFAVLVVVLGRLKGLRALVGLGISLAVVTQFIVPAILGGAAPLLVALTGSLAVMLVTVFLAHGTGVTSIAAVLGSAASLVVTALLAVLFAGLAEITGFSSEAATLLQGSSGQAGSELSLQGLLLAGIVVGALGVLDDVTVSQASTVVALQRVDPRQTFSRLFRGAITVGRDHLSATVNTLVLAYVGAALPVLLIFEQQGTSFGSALNAELVAAEVVAMLVGSIGLILAVPLTTALAAWLARMLPPDALPDDVHAHQH
jgi:uncharacterized membrane protein